MLKKLLNPSADRADLILRIALGVVFFAHGSQKVLGWFGGYGWAGTLGFFQQALGIPPFWAGLSFLAELLGGILILLGLLTRPAALSIAVTMFVAGMKVGLPNGFFLDTQGPKDGVEYVFVLLLIAVYFIIKGAGKISLDAVISKSKQ